MNHRIIRFKEAQLMTGLSCSTIYAEIAKGNFPKQIRLTGTRSVDRHEHVVIEWIKSRR
ncbi:MAG: AlpA family phage regulatory protein [Gammaproteobacteria bacterium]|nr:AlpA family phage regulatory protein [Gammaproteobacteria bacterium]